MTESNSGESDKPSFSEIVEGRDVVLAEEIVRNLVAEGIVLPVYYHEPGIEKKDVIVDRKPGEENYTVMEKHRREGKLLGAIVSPSEGEYIFIGIRERGLIIKITYKTFKDWYSLTRISSYDTNSLTFRECVADDSFSEILMTEDSNPEEFNRRVVSAVETARAEELKNKARRSESRSNLKRALFRDQQ